MELPARIGKYELVEHLGGGMASVYRARDTILGRTVALKMLTEAGCSDSETKARFLQEARMAGNIDHPNIISIFDFGEDQGRPFIVMEFLRGESLADAIRLNHTGDFGNKLKMAAQIARALEYIHDKKIIHRDVKPENVHVDVSGKIKLVDFGIAKSEGLSLTRTGFTLGTPYYMAPEQILGSQITPLVDVYAFGILLFELLSGVKPISGDTVERIFRQILHEPLNLEPLKQAGVSPGLCQLVAQCAAKRPEERFQNFNAVAVALESMAQQASLASSSASRQSVPATTGFAQSGVSRSGLGMARQSPSGQTPVMAEPEAPNLPTFMDRLPPRFRTQETLIAVIALAVLAGMLLVYSMLRLISRLIP